MCFLLHDTSAHCTHIHTLSMVRIKELWIFLSFEHIKKRDKTQINNQSFKHIKVHKVTRTCFHLNICDSTHLHALSHTHAHMELLTNANNELKNCIVCNANRLINDPIFTFTTTVTRYHLQSHGEEDHTDKLWFFMIYCHLYIYIYIYRTFPYCLSKGVTFIHKAASFYSQYIFTKSLLLSHILLLQWIFFTLCVCSVYSAWQDSQHYLLLAGQKIWNRYNKQYS